jgi:hypothetical protein
LVLRAYLKVLLDKFDSKLVSDKINHPTIKSRIKKRYSGLNGDGTTFLEQLKQQLGL